MTAMTFLMFFQDTYFPQARDPVVGVEPFLIEFVFKGLMNKLVADIDLKVIVVFAYK